MILKGKITLEEHIETEFNLADPAIRDRHVLWEAHVEGVLVGNGGVTQVRNNGISVSMSRTAIHAGEALADLTEAIKAEGWTFRDEAL